MDAPAADRKGRYHAVPMNNPCPKPTRTGVDPVSTDALVIYNGFCAWCSKTIGYHWFLQGFVAFNSHGFYLGDFKNLGFFMVLGSGEGKIGKMSTYGEHEPTYVPACPSYGQHTPT